MTAEMITQFQDINKILRESVNLGNVRDVPRAIHRLRRFSQIGFSDVNSNLSQSAKSVDCHLGTKPPRHSYQTSTRKRPQAGAVEPAIERSCAARMRATSSLSHLWRPTLTSVPTMLRTML